MNEITTESWQDLVNNVGNIADKTQRQLIEVQSHITELNNTLEVTNIILGVIATAYIISLIIKLIKTNKK